MTGAAILEESGSQEDRLPISTARFRIQNMCCDAEVTLINELLGKKPGVKDIKVSSSSSSGGGEGI